SFGFVLLSSMYLYVLAAIFLSMTFVCFRAWGPASARVPWYDWLLAALSLLACGYFAATADASLMAGWEYAPPPMATWVSVVLYLLILEATRRTGGTVLFIIVAIFSLYPTFASHIPDPLSGFQQPFLA